MIRRIAISALVALSFATSASADVREVDQSELRGLIKSGEAQSLAIVLKAIGSSIDGDPVDVRAFDADGLVYALMFMMSDGKLAMIVVDAVSGQVLPPRSQRASLVLTTAQTTPGAKGNGLGAQKSNRGKAKGKDKDKGKDKGKKK